MVERSLSFSHAKKLLGNVCKFLKPEHPPIDFVIPGREALILTKYTPACFPIDGEISYRFSGRSTEYFTLISHRVEYSYVTFGSPYSIVYTAWSPALEELDYIFSRPLSLYFEAFPHLKKDKHLILVDTEKYWYRGTYAWERASEEAFSRMEKAGLRPEDCVVWYGPNTGEPFWEYLAAVILRSKGYFVTDYNLGAGDISAYYIPDYYDALRKRGLISTGAFLEELEMLPQPKQSGPTKLENEVKLVLIEAESTDRRTKSRGSNAGIGQVLYFLQRAPCYYTHAFVAGPYCKPEDIYEDFIGLISCDENGNLVYREAERYRETPEKAVQLVKTVIKSRLLRNLTFQEKCELIGGKPTNPKEYYEKLAALDIDTILDYLETKIETRT